MTAYPVVVVVLVAEVSANCDVLELDTTGALIWLDEVEALLDVDVGARTVGTVLELVVDTTFEVDNEELNEELSRELILSNEVPEGEALLLDDGLLEDATLEGELLKGTTLVEVLLGEAVLVDELPNKVVLDVKLVDDPALDDVMLDDTTLVELLEEPEIIDVVETVGSAPTTEPATLVTGVDESTARLALLTEVSTARLVVATELLVEATTLDVD